MSWIRDLNYIADTICRPVRDVGNATSNGLKIAHTTRYPVTSIRNPAYVHTAGCHIETDTKNYNPYTPPSCQRNQQKTNSKDGALGRIRTSDRLVRSQVLYPAELRTHTKPQDLPTRPGSRDVVRTNMICPGKVDSPITWFVTRHFTSSG